MHVYKSSRKCIPESGLIAKDKLHGAVTVLGGMLWCVMVPPNHTGAAQVAKSSHRVSLRIQEGHV